MTDRLVAALGVALTTGLLTAVLLTELLAARIAFSAIVALPAGVVAGAAAGIATWLRLWDRPTLRPALLGGGTVGYALLAVATISYTVPPTRGFVTPVRTLAVAVACGGGAFVYALVRRRADRETSTPE